MSHCSQMEVQHVGPARRTAAAFACKRPRYDCQRPSSQSASTCRGSQSDLVVHPFKRPVLEAKQLCGWHICPKRMSFTLVLAETMHMTATCKHVSAIGRVLPV